jgi:hypothetical protein
MLIKRRETNRNAPWPVLGFNSGMFLKTEGNHKMFGQDILVPKFSSPPECSALLL